MAIITGGSGNDILAGTRNADKIDGGARRDYINGGGGNDTITGGLGNDILAGAAGADAFFFGHLHDADVIQDFSEEDGIILGGGIDHYFVTEVWNGVRIATVDFDYTADVVQGSVVLVGVTPAEWVSWGGLFGNPAGYAAWTMLA
jgi:Ca2+-binding RTX toxin-like protein